MPPHHPHHHAHANQWNGPQPAPRALWTLVHANFPQTRFDGIYNQRNIAGTNTPSLHAEGRALDIGLDVRKPTEKTIGDGLFQIFIDVAGQAGFEEIIWNRQIWSTRNPHIHHYTGQSPHTDHVHVGFTRQASQTTTFPGTLTLKIAILRSGLEDLSRAMSSFA
jgi:hypothetical protein